MPLAPSVRFTTTYFLSMGRCDLPCDLTLDLDLSGVTVSARFSTVQAAFHIHHARCIPLQPRRKKYDNSLQETPKVIHSLLSRKRHISICPASRIAFEGTFTQPGIQIHTTNSRHRMGRKRSGTRALFARLFVRPYESVQSYGSVHHLARVGGVSVLSLSKDHAPCDLVIPTRFVATAQFLADNGKSSPFPNPP